MSVIGPLAAVSAVAMITGVLSRPSLSWVRTVFAVFVALFVAVLWGPPAVDAALAAGGLFA